MNSTILNRAVRAANAAENAHPVPWTGGPSTPPGPASAPALAIIVNQIAD